jgi:ribosome-associated toxin RatA of RatAB toxin-antitoxin module
MSTATREPELAVGAWPTTRRLRAALRANAAFSVLCGGALAAAGGFLAGPWDLGPAAGPPLLGLGVAGFGLLMARVAVQPARSMRRWAVLVVAADAAWVAGSAGLLALHRMPWPATVTVAAVAIVVACLAAWQVAGRAAVRGDDPLADLEVVEASRVLAAAPGAVWPLVSDHGLYGQLAPNLAGVEVISQVGDPLRRRCTNTAGEAWEETCTLWEDGRRFAVEVDTASYPYPLRRLRGLWQVDPAPAGSRITMRFAYQAEPSFAGGLFTIGLRLASPLLMSRIFRGWRDRVAKPSTEERPRAEA